MNLAGFFPSPVSLFISLGAPTKNSAALAILFDQYSAMLLSRLLLFFRCDFFLQLIYSFEESY